MDTKLFFDDYEVIDSRSALFFKNQSKFLIDITVDNFNFQIEFLRMYHSGTIIGGVSYPPNRIKKVELSTDKNKITIHCTNFYDRISGNDKPIEIATINSKKLYINFWITINGDESTDPLLSKIDYTIYAKKAGAIDGE